jgi:hypothetical protein
MLKLLLQILNMSITVIYDNIITPDNRYISLLCPQLNDPILSSACMNDPFPHLKSCFLFTMRFLYLIVYYYIPTFGTHEKRF